MGGRKKGSRLRLVLGWLPRIPHPLSPSKEPNLAAPCQGPQQHLPQGRWHQRMLELLPLQEALQGTRAPDKSSFLKLYEDAVTPLRLRAYRNVTRWSFSFGWCCVSLGSCSRNATIWPWRVLWKRRAFDLHYYLCYNTSVSPYDLS